MSDRLHANWTIEVETEDGGLLDLGALGSLLRQNGIRVTSSRRGRALLTDPQKPAEIEPPEPIYFCGVRPGTRNGHHCQPSTGLVTPWGSVSAACTLLDWHPDRDGLSYNSAIANGREHNYRGITETEGEFVHLIVGGWTLIAAWDRSADKRPGCTASFAMPGEHGAEIALAFARARWPRVFARIETHLGASVTVRGWAE